jgi:hypothetical protein
MEIFRNPSYDFGKRVWTYLLSGLVVLVSLISLAIQGLREQPDVLDGDDCLVGQGLDQPDVVVGKLSVGPPILDQMFWPSTYPRSRIASRNGPTRLASRAAVEFPRNPICHTFPVCWA